MFGGVGTYSPCEGKVTMEYSCSVGVGFTLTTLSVNSESKDVLADCISEMARTLTTPLRWSVRLPAPQLLQCLRQDGHQMPHWGSRGARIAPTYRPVVWSKKKLFSVSLSTTISLPS
eukprot:COSAG04_NODE_113_length_25735_cov_4.728468_7_plen_117_part_00